MARRVFDPALANDVKGGGEGAENVDREDRPAQIPAESASRPRARRHIKPPEGETTRHGVFHLLAVLLAFIMGNLFAVHAESQKDLRTQLAVLHAIEWELGRAQNRVGDLSRRATSPCIVSWKDGPIDTKVWHDVFATESVLLLQDVPLPHRSPGDAAGGRDQAAMAPAAKTLLDELRSTYDELELAPTKTGAIGSELDCATQMGAWVRQVNQTRQDLSDQINGVSRRYRLGQFVFSQPLWLAVTAIFGLLWIWTLLRGRLAQR